MYIGTRVWIMWKGHGYGGHRYGGDTGMEGTREWM